MKKLLFLISIFYFGSNSAQTLVDVYCQSFENYGSSSWVNHTARIPQPELSSQDVQVFIQHDGSSMGTINYGSDEWWGNGVISQNSICSNTNLGSALFTNDGNTNISRTINLIFVFSNLTPGEYKVSLDYKYEVSYSSNSNNSDKIRWKPDNDYDYSYYASIPHSMTWDNFSHEIDKLDFASFTYNPIFVNSDLEITIEVKTGSHFDEHLLIDNVVLQRKSPLSINEKTIKKINAYPNPFNTSTTVNLPSVPHNLKIYDLLGNMVRSCQVQGETIIERENLTNGVYLFDVESENATYFGKLVVD